MKCAKCGCGIFEAYGDWMHSDRGYRHVVGEDDKIYPRCKCKEAIPENITKERKNEN